MKRLTSGAFADDVVGVVSLVIIAGGHIGNLDRTAVGHQQTSQQRLIVILFLFSSISTTDKKKYCCFVYYHRSPLVQTNCRATPQRDKQ